MPRLPRLISSAAIVLSIASASAQAATVWSSGKGATHIAILGERAQELGLVVTASNDTPAESGIQVLELAVAPAAPLTFVAEGSLFESFATPTIRHDGTLYIASGEKLLAIEEFAIEFLPTNDAGQISAQILDKSTNDVLLLLPHAKLGFDSAGQELSIEGAGLTIAKPLADALDRPDLAGREIGDITIAAELVWSGGDVPLPPTDTPPAEDPGAPRGGNNGTVCPQPVGPDVITGVISDIGNYGSFEWPAGSGTWYDAFSVGTTSCNIGSIMVLWDDDLPAPTNLHPVIGQNFYRLQTLPNGTTRFQQIGQSWLKHGFTVAAGNACGCGCSGPGGPQLHPGCSDPYGSFLNGSQSSLGPRWQVNGRTGEFPHPYQEGVSLPGGSEIYKRLQVKTSTLGTPNSLYFAEAQYVTQDDHQAGNASNNASYLPISLTGGPTAWNATVAGTTIRERSAIRAWKVNVPSVVETDIYISPPAGDPFPNARDYFILAANVVALPDGYFAYEYALYNMHSHQAARSFSVPLVPGADIRNVEFNDVDYHSGEPFDGTDWSWSFEDGFVTWSTATFAQNPNANALRWGTLYNFRFEANIGPDPAGGLVDVGLFRNDPGWPVSVQAATVVPLGAAVLINLPDGTPELLDSCAENTLTVEIKNGAATYEPGSARLFLSHTGNSGPFLDYPLAPMGGDLYEATFPPVACADNIRYFIAAEGDDGSISTNPPDALASNDYYAPEVGFYEEVSLLFENFEAGLGDWNATGLWNVTAQCPVSPFCASTGSNWAYYGLPGTCNYDTGQVHAGSLSRTIALPAGQSIQLTYCSAYERHSFPNGDLPQLRVNGVVVDVPSDGQPVGLPARWESRTVDLSAFAGQQVTLSFDFGNLVALADDYLGWQIDDIHVYGVVVSCHESCACGDMNVDNLTDGRDLGLFVTAVLNESTLPADVQAGDFSGDQVVDVADINGMVNALLSGCE